MAGPLRLMGIFAHPDDESLGNGGTFVKYASEGVETFLVTATRGHLGWFGKPDENPGPDALGKIREGELRAAAEVLGIQDVTILDYVDGDLDQAQPAKVIGEIVAQLRRVRPEVVLTFEPFGVFGHPDHIAICQFTTAAVAAAASPTFDGAGGREPHQVSKLYYMSGTNEKWAAYQAAMGELVMQIDGSERRPVGWPEWSITTSIDTSAHWERVWQAVSCHRSQLPGYEGLKDLPETHHQNLWGKQAYYRVLSLVNGGRSLETDLFEGLR